jgi:uncharacterized OB-fold protein
MADRKMPTPVSNPESDAFYEAAKEGKFLIRRCTKCHKRHWYPRALCPFCFGPTEWEAASGDGIIYSYSPMRRANYTIAYVTLAEGPTMLTNLVDCDPDKLAIGQKVKLTFVPTEDGPPVPCFTSA